MSYHPQQLGVEQMRGHLSGWGRGVDEELDDVDPEPARVDQIAPHNGAAALVQVPVKQRADVAGEIVDDDLMERAEKTKVDPLASTEPPDLQGVDHEQSGAMPPEQLVLGGEVESADEIEGLPTRVEARPDLMHRDSEGQPRLVVIGGADRGREFRLQEGEFSVGRGLDNDVVLADIAVSRHHTTIVARGGAYEVRDSGSGNGTLVNGKRVTTQALRTGDQIELGNTLLRFVNPKDPLIALGEAETQVGEIVAAPTGAGRALPPEAVATVDEMYVAARPSTERRRSGLGRSTKLLLFGGIVLVAFFGVMLLLKAVLDRRAGKHVVASSVVVQTNGSNAAASEHFDRGRKYLRNRQWRQARDEFEKVYGLAPRFEQAKRYVRQAKAEARAQDAITKARQALADGAFDLARSRLAQVPATSVYASGLPKLKEQIDSTQVTQLLSQAATLRDSGAIERAREVAQQALRIAPADQEVRRLLDDLGRPGSAVARAARKTVDRSRGRRAKSHRRARAGASDRRRRSTSAGATPGEAHSTSARSSRPRSAVKTKLRGQSKRVLQRALALYANKDWPGAASLLEEHAKGEGGALQQGFEQRAKAMRQVGKTYRDALAVQTRDPGRAIRLYQQAIKADGKASGGTLKHELEGRLYKVARLLSVTSLNTGRYHSAYEGLKLAKHYGETDGQLKGVEDALERKAADLFTKGYTLRNRNASEARRLWQRVLRMVSPESTTYQKAYKWLNNSAPAYIDEDEL